MNSKKIAAGIAAVCALGLAIPAAALSVNAAGSASGNASVGTGVVSGNALIGASSSANAGGNNGLGAEIKNVVNAIVGGSASDSASSSTNASGSVGVQASGAILPIVITRADIESQGTTNGTVSSGSVQTDTDLSAFIQGQMTADTNVQEVQASSDGVQVTYKVPGKFLGFIPVQIDTTATVHADGSVSIDYPWYGFLVSTTSDLQASVESRVHAALDAGGASADVSGNANVLATAQERAQLIEEIRVALQAEAVADATGSVSVQ